MVSLLPNPKEFAASTCITNLNQTGFNKIGQNPTLEPYSEAVPEG
ncbi:MAG: hypothetical protein AB4426_29545 [Xenococcaceae cyanobacterium]